MYFDNDESLENNVPFFLIFDVETTGLPKRNYGSLPHYQDINKYNNSRIVQLSYSTYSFNSKKKCKKNYIIKSNNLNPLLKFKITEESLLIHGIDEKKSESIGVYLNKCLHKFYNKLNKITVIVGHNIDFDLAILKSELWRLYLSNNINKSDIDSKSIFYKNFIKLLSSKKTYCTMKRNVNLCKIPFDTKNTNKVSYKYPKLEELYETLFKKKPKHCHDASYDIKYTAKCFFRIRKLWMKQNNISN